MQPWFADFYTSLGWREGGWVDGGEGLKLKCDCSQRNSCKDLSAPAPLSPAPPTSPPVPHAPSHPWLFWQLRALM